MLADHIVNVMRFLLFVVVAAAALLLCGHSRAQPFEALEHGLDIHAPDGLIAQNADLAEAMRKLHVPSADVALIENGRLAWSHTLARPRTMQSIRPRRYRSS